MSPCSRLSATLMCVALYTLIASHGYAEGPPQSADVLQVREHSFFNVDQGIRSCALSPDGKKLLLGQNKFTIAMYDLSKSAYDRVWEMADWTGESPSDVFVALSPDGHDAAAGLTSPRRSGGAIVEILDATRTTGQFTGTGSRGVRAVRFSPDGKTLATGGDDDAVTLWDWKNHKVRAFLKGHTGSVYAIAFSPDGRTIASAGGDRTIRLWQADTGAPIRVFAGLKNTVEALVWSPDGKRLASAGPKGDMLFWDLNAGEPDEFTLPAFGPVYGMTWSPDGRVLVTAGRYEDATDGKTAIMILWDMRTGYPLSVTDAHGGGKGLTSAPGTFFDVCISRDGHTIAGVGQEADGRGRVEILALGGWTKSSLSPNNPDNGPFKERLAFELAPRHVGAGDYFRDQQDLAAAEREYRQAIALDARVEGGYRSLGALLLAQDKPADAEKELRLAVDASPTDALGHALLAQSLVDQKKSPEAESEFRRALDLDPKQAQWHDAFGFLLEGEQRFPEAEAEYRQAIQLNPKSAGAHVDLANTLMFQGKNAAAAPEYDLALSLDAKAVGALHFGAWNSLIQRKGDAALAAARGFLAAQGWRNTQSMYAAFVGHFAARETARDDEGRALLDQCAKSCDTAVWPYPVVRYLRREISDQQLLALATDNDKLTEAHAYVGMDLSLSDKRTEALPHLQWVAAQGNKSFMEYLLANAELLRLGAGKDTYAWLYTNHLWLERALSIGGRRDLFVCACDRNRSLRISRL